MRLYPFCTRPTRLIGFYNANLLKRRHDGRHAAPLGHIILIPSQPVVVLTH